ncbi:HN1_G0002570.mRNA.1.CDS.1 [Saccharomyces cerevisiae]|nr:HN1_G0002570.mRNA.1.CDS.1 [Saccharomyces cerevisiae]CAI4415858.1 BAL_1a_G0016110.mRNA.1.CDS.1 [Saccharomyces cerevisiae]CAI7106268.1 BAL_1a_G0016110.mRNA.1.CDS.1 [Saccharomyces cerevisiae]
MAAKRKLAKQNSRVAKACERCRRKKVKCDNKKPCFGCIGSQSKCTYKNQHYEPIEAFFNYTGSLSNDLDDVKCSIAKLKTQLPPSAPASLQKDLANICTVLEKIQPQLYLNLDSREISSYDGLKSIETEIIGKQSKFLNRFSNAFESNTAQNVSMYFGVYSPLLYFTSTGISWITKKLISCSDDRETRETIYLFLKFLDASSASHASPKVTSISPLEYYAKLNGLSCGNDVLIQHIMSNISNEVKEDTNITQTIKSNKPTDWFMYGIHLMEQHHKALNCKSSEFLSLKYFFEQDELIFCLCLEYFERSIFSTMYDLSMLKGLISLMKHRYWIDDPIVLGRIICTMSRRSLDAGLNRWEYYIGQDEVTAEVYRKIWWDCYWWDRWYSLVTGKQPLIPDEMTSCLFPKGVVGLGVDDSMDCFTLINSVELNPSKLDICISFGYILLTKIITEVFSGLLYNRHFTDYRLFATPDTKDINATARQFIDKFSKIYRIFQHVQDKLISFLKHYSENSSVFELYTHFGFAKVCCFQGMESLILRIQNLLHGREKTELDSCVNDIRLQTFQASVDILKDVLRLRESFHIFRCSWFIYVILMNITSYFVENPGEDLVYCLSLVCQVSSLFNDLFVSSDDIIMKSNNAFYRKLKNGTTVSFIVTRICCQMYVRSLKVPAESLFCKLKKYGQTCSDAGQTALDIECIWYKNVIGEHKESNFRKEILSILDRDMSDLVNDTDIGTQGKNEEGAFYGELPLTSTSVPVGMDFGSLEDFVTSGSLPDFLNLLWEDIESGISKENFGK